MQWGAVPAPCLAVHACASLRALPRARRPWAPLQFWDAHTAVAQLQAGGYFPEGAPLPPALAALRDGGAGQAAAAHALGGCLSHLRELLLDKQVRWMGMGPGGGGSPQAAGQARECQCLGAASAAGAGRSRASEAQPQLLARFCRAGCSRWPTLNLCSPLALPPLWPCVQVMAAGRVEQLAETFGIGAGLAGGAATAGGGDCGAGPQYTALDGAALENLEASSLLFTLRLLRHARSAGFGPGVCGRRRLGLMAALEGCC